MATHLFGIRHHGPGSARSLVQALEALEPDCVLIEGPPDAEGVLPLLSHEQMQPPVALLLYDPDKPSRAVYDPFLTYSPEWQAIRYAQGRNIPVRFMDLPQTIQMAIDKQKEEEAAEALAVMLRAIEAEQAAAPPPKVNTDEEATDEAIALLPESEENPAESQEETETPASQEDLTEQVWYDPLNWIAEAAGYSDGESWWEHMVEQRRDSTDLFQGIIEIMTAARAAMPPHPDPERNLREERREAWMRQTLRTAEKEGFQRIAVVCGAWHTPALAERPDAKADAETLRGLPKQKVTATWIPWTYSRIARASGYGAGVNSPAWYEHLWNHEDRIVASWMTRAAQLFRAEDLPASPASVIEAVRLAEALAAMRDRPIPGLPDLWEAARAIFCFGSDTPMQLIQQKLIVGERLGHVPDETPMLPIQQDLRREQRRLRMPPEALHSDKDFDQRDPNDLERIVLLRRLRLLGIPWGEPQSARGGKGTFHEWWRLQWHPEFEVRLIEANVYGNAVRAASAQCVREKALHFETVSDVAALIEETLPADLPETMEWLVERLSNLAALISDVQELMGSLPKLTDAARYGDARKHAQRADEADKWEQIVEPIHQVLRGMIVRICIGLPNACSALNDEAAETMYHNLNAVHRAIPLIEEGAHQEIWNATLERLANMNGLHTLIAGRCCRMLLDQGVWTSEEVGRRLGLALSPANEPIQAAAWIEGLLRDSGEILVHTDELWPLLDRWVVGLPSETFVELLPLVRRTFSTFPTALRRQLGERAKGETRRSLPGLSATDLDVERAERTLPLLAQLLGLPLSEVNS